MFSEIIEDLTRNGEGASLIEKLLATPPHKFCYPIGCSILSDTNSISLLWDVILIMVDFTFDFC